MVMIPQTNRKSLILALGLVVLNSIGNATSSDIKSLGPIKFLTLIDDKRLLSESIVCENDLASVNCTKIKNPESDVDEIVASSSSSGSEDHEEVRSKDLDSFVPSNVSIDAEFGSATVKLSISDDGYNYNCLSYEGGIYNANRKVMTRGTLLDYYTGPVYFEKSVAMCIFSKEREAFELGGDGIPNNVRVIGANVPNKNMGYFDFYKKYADMIPSPDALNIDDESFGFQRLSFRGFNMKSAQSDWDKEIIHKIEKEVNVMDVCGLNNSPTAKSNSIGYYVSDFSKLDEYVFDKSNFTQYAPALKSYYCYNEGKKNLIPIGIWIKASNILYTPKDMEQDWLLAKIAVNVAENVHQQMTHLISTHGFILPMRIETYRHMNPDHPIRRFMYYHTMTDINTDFVAVSFLLKDETEFDYLFGLGAYGGISLINDYIKHNNFNSSSFENDITIRGVNKISNHQYYKYGSMYYKAYKSFITEYINTYYSSDSSLKNDITVQNWIKALSEVRQLSGFPSSIEDKETLITILTEVAFRSTFRHHSMNGDNAWHTISMPYSPMKLIKEMPKEKSSGNKVVDYRNYIPLDSDFPSFLFVVSNFVRPLTRSTSVSRIYEDFVKFEPKLLAPATKIGRDMYEIEKAILLDDNKAGNFRRMRPSSISSNSVA